MKRVKIECFAVYDSIHNDPEKYVLFSSQLEASKYCDDMGEDFKVCSYTKEFKIYKSKKEHDELTKDSKVICQEFHNDMFLNSENQKNIEAIKFVKLR
uniref:Uncharacterized protein n=1 Tax=viral metagenome TaxID=1070528 RepID=A0A6C0ADM9_9ZZZZ